MAQQEQGAEPQCAWEHHHHLYRLVALQIGDIQSYVSRLFLFMVCNKSSLVLLVDNGPWSTNETRSRPAELWQLMVTKSRVSPFANQRLNRRTFVSNEECTFKMAAAGKNQNTASNHYEGDFFGTLQRRYRTLVHSRIFRPQFHGCVAFEISWADVRGMNYLNELQTETCLSLEVKIMIKREFDSLQQAVDFYSAQCNFVEQQKNAKRERGPSSTGDIVDKCKRQCLTEDGNDCTFNEIFSFSPEKFCSPDSTIIRGFSAGTGFQTNSPCSRSPPFCSRRKLRTSRDSVQSLVLRQEVPVAHTFKDAFVVFRFSDPLLPCELRDIITSDQRLLKMLESGLPPWVIFLQSYPLLCQLYRPWMRPLARTIYFLVSVVTVMIGFYDLYKNVPVLKATAAHMLGPLFEWIESWEMVSRLKYLGTMLVLQNYEKAFMWVVLSIKAVRQLISLLMRPVMEPLLFLCSFFLPFWASLVQEMQSLGLVLSSFCSSLLVAIGYVLNLVIWPFCILLSTLWSLVYTILCPLFSAVRMVLLLPIYVGQYVGELWGYLSYNLLDVLKQVWTTTAQTFQLVRVTSSPFVSSVQSPRSPSAWRLLWDDLFSKVFRAVRYILNGLVTFFTALNRHRLSTYNNMVAFLVRVVRMMESGRRLANDTWHRVYPLRSTADPTIRSEQQNLKED